MNADATLPNLLVGPACLEVCRLPFSIGGMQEFAYYTLQQCIAYWAALNCVFMVLQMFPNFINEPNFAKCIVTPDSPYQTTQIWRFYNASDGLSAGA